MKKATIQFAVLVLILSSPLILLITGHFEWFWYVIIPLSLMSVYFFVTHLGPLSIAYLRLRELRHSLVEEARQEWVYDLHTHFGRLKGTAEKWRFARESYDLAVYEIAVELFYDVPEAVQDARYRNWFGAEAYSLFHIIVQFQGDNEGIPGLLDRMMAAGIADYATFYGYCEAANVEAALLAFEHDLPIDYAKELAE